MIYRSTLGGTPRGKWAVCMLSYGFSMTALFCLSWVFPDPLVCPACSSLTFAQWDSSQECLRDKGSWACADLEIAFCFSGCCASVRTIWGHFYRQSAASSAKLGNILCILHVFVLVQPEKVHQWSREGLREVVASAVCP